MSKTHVYSKADPSIQYPVLVVNGKSFPVIFDTNNISNVPNLRMRDDDVLICGYMRAGTHWMFEILNMLLRGNTDTVPDRKESLHLEHDTAIGKIDDYPSPRVLNSHLFFEELPREVMTRKTKIVYLMRDPRDSLVSWYKCMTTIMKSYDEKWYIPFELWVEMSNDGKLDWGSWFQNIKSWETAIKDHPEHPIHVVFYEELRHDPVREIVKLKEFLSLPRDEEFCRQVADKTRLDKMKENKKEFTQIYSGQIVHYGKGEIGNWRTMFTPALKDEFNRRYETEMEGSRFKDRYLFP